MQVYPHLVNWEWLSGLPDPTSRVDALDELMEFMEPDKVPADRLVRCYELGCWPVDSAIMLMETGEGLVIAADDAGEVVAGLIRAAFPLVASYDLEAVDELGLRLGRESYYYGSVSPAGVAAGVAAAAQLDLGWLAQRTEPDDVRETEAYLILWLEVFREAQRRGMGVVVSCR